MSVRRGAVLVVLAVLAAGMGASLVRAADPAREYRELDLSVSKYAVSSQKSKLVRIAVVLPDSCAGTPWMSMVLEGKKRIVLRVRGYSIAKQDGQPVLCAQALTVVCGTVKLSRPIAGRQILEYDGDSTNPIPSVPKTQHPISGEPRDLAHPADGKCPVLPTSQPDPPG